MAVMTDPTREVQRLQRALSAAWDAQTSADPEGWAPGNPAWGQCAVTALIIQDRFGGDLLRTVVDGMSHYWNMLDDGSEIDLTRHQFPPGSHAGPPAHRDRAYVLSFPETQRRYDLLRQRLAAVGTER